MPPASTLPRHTRAELIEAIQAWAARYGQPPTVMDWDPAGAQRRGQQWRVDRYREDRWPTSGSLRKEFGSFGAALVAAGYGARRPVAGRKPRVVGRDAILRAIRRWAAQYGEPPSMIDWDPARARTSGSPWRVQRYYDGVWPSTRSVCAHFGNFAAAVLAAGLTPRERGVNRESTPPWRGQALEAVRALHDVPRRQAVAEALASRVNGVVEARREADSLALRAELVELAAVAVEWAELLAEELEISECIWDQLAEPRELVA